VNILHVTPAYYPATYWGGPVYSTFELCNALASLPEVNLRVLTTDTAGPKLSDRLEVEAFPAQLPPGYEVYYCRRVLALSFSPGLLLRLWAMIRRADVVHLTAVYSAPTIPTLLLCKLLKKPVVWAPKGALQRWQGATRPQAKKIWEGICNLLCDRERVMLHCTSEKEREDSISRIDRATAFIIPNGIDLASASMQHEQSADGRLRLLYFGRLHPIKGIENLLRAMTNIEPDVSLAIYGEGDPDYRRSLEALAHSLALQERVRFFGQVEAEKKSICFNNTDVCVVPSFSENFGMVVVESLAHGVPVIASWGTPWGGVEDVGCGLWVDNSSESLAMAIKRIRRMPLQRMGQKGRDWIEREFSSRFVAERMMKIYWSIAA